MHPYLRYNNYLTSKSLNLFVCTCLLLAACKATSYRYQLVETEAENTGFQRQIVKTNYFTLTTFHKGLGQKNKLLNIYIEGDGYAWKRRNYLSTDPTPKNPVAFNLAVQDPNATVLYIARPCQYLSTEELKTCKEKYWSSHRYADEVIDSINEVIDWGLNKSGANSISLYGYSGGGTVAVLAAARRNDITSITTIAANLDHVMWTDIHNITPLTGSLNAADYVSKVEDIPQLHLVGEKDQIVPGSIIESYKSNATRPDNISIKIIPDFNHECCWESHWLKLIEEYNTFGG